MEHIEGSDSDRRKSKRVDQACTVRFQLRSGFGLPWNLVLVRDISSGGIFFNHDKELPPGTALNIKINLGLDEPAMECSGKVLRCGTLGPADIYEVAVQFDTLDAAKKGFVDRAVQRFEIQKAKEKLKEQEEQEEES